MKMYFNFHISKTLKGLFVSYLSCFFQTNTVSLYHNTKSDTLLRLFDGD